MKINVTASRMVKPTASTPNTTLWISNLDATMPANCHTLILYFYSSNGAAADFFDVAVLKAALSRILVEFYPVAGRLKKDDNNRIEIDCNGEGALFVEAEADGEMDDLGDFAPRAALSLIPAVDYTKEISTFPLLLVQATRFKCGGVCLGIAIEHHASDGFSDFHLINTFADIASSRDVVTAIPPFFDRRLLSARRPPQPQFDHVEYHPPPQLKYPQDDNSSNSETIFSVFQLTRDQLNALKAKCKSDDEGNNKVIYSTYEALAGHLWRCVCKARGLPEDQETKLYIPVNGRFRLRPPLPSGYFGNVLFTATPVASYGELESNPLKFAVRKIHEAIAQMDDEYLRSAIDYLEVQEDLNAHARGASPYKSPNLGIISWAKFPVYEADFGWGKPVYVGVGAIPSEGKTILLPSSTNDGSLLYAISLPKEQMQVFEKLLYDI